MSKWEELARCHREYVQLLRERLQSLEEKERVLDEELYTNAPLTYQPSNVYEEGMRLMAEIADFKQDIRSEYASVPYGGYYSKAAQQGIANFWLAVGGEL